MKKLEDAIDNERIWRDRWEERDRSLWDKDRMRRSFYKGDDAYGDWWYGGRRGYYGDMPHPQKRNGKENVKDEYGWWYGDYGP